MLRVLRLAGAMFIALIIFASGSAQAGAAPVGFVFQALQPAANNSISSSLSRNWSGYVAENGNYTSVTGTWIVPSVTSSHSLAADAAWVGIGGMTSHDLIQIGTQSIVQDGQVTYQGWYELLPDVSVPLDISIHPGDMVTATITQVSSGKWALSLVDHTTGKSYATVVPYTSSRSSAEWVEEMPSAQYSDGSRDYLPLADFGTVSFMNAAALVDGTPETLQQAGAHALNMSKNGNVFVQTSDLTNGTAFTVQQVGGSTQQSTPETPFVRIVHLQTNGSKFERTYSVGPYTVTVMFGS